MGARIDYIDNAKAIAIVLVVVGHAPAFATAVIDFIFIFHMPLFLFLSGFLLRAERLEAGFARYVGGVLSRLLPPYILFFLISWLLWLPSHSYGPRAAQFTHTAWYEPLAGLFLGYGDALYVNTVLWFFPCLIVTHLAYYLIRRRGGLAMATLLSVALSLLAPLLLERNGTRLWFGLDNAVVAIGFYAVGVYVRERHIGLLDAPPRGVALLVAVSGFVLCYFAVRYTGRVDMNSLYFGAVAWLYTPAALAGIAMSMAIASLVKPNRVFQWLSRNTLVIFPLHVLMFYSFTGIGVFVFGLPLEFKQQSMLFGLAYTTGALLLCYPAAKILGAIWPRLFARDHLRTGCGENILYSPDDAQQR